MNAFFIKLLAPPTLSVYIDLFCFVFHYISIDDLTTLDNIFSKFRWKLIKTETLYIFSY